MKKIGTIMMVALFAAVAAQAVQIYYGMESDALLSKTVTDGLTADGSQNGTGVSNTGDANVDLEVNSGAYFGSHGLGWFSSAEANDTIEVAGTSGTALGNQFTLAAYVDTSLTASYNRIMSTHDGAGSLVNDLFFIIKPGGHSTASWEYTIALQVDNVMVRAYANSGATTFGDGGWHHVAATYNAGTVNLYVDGTLEASGTAGDGSITLDQNIMIGGDRAGGYANGQFKGQMDDILIWDEALNATQIADIAADGAMSVIPEPATMGLVGLFGGALMVLRRKLMI